MCGVGEPGCAEKPRITKFLFYKESIEGDPQQQGTWLWATTVKMAEKNSRQSARCGLPGRECEGQIWGFTQEKGRLNLL